jgi:Ca2+-transporting ATPase
VVRDGKRVSVDADQVVPGDVVFIKSGDKVPADLRLLQVTNLQVSSSSSSNSSSSSPNA